MLYNETVRRAACALDEVFDPDGRSWVLSVTQPLDLRSSSRCVLGQVYGNFSVGRSRLGLDRPRGEALRAAFGIEVNAAQRAVVVTAWRRELRRRRRALTSTAEAGAEVRSDDA